MYDPAQRSLALRLLACGWTLEEVHRQTGIAKSTLGNWRQSVYEETTSPPPSCPLCHGRGLDERAYAQLLGLYLGDGHIVSTTRRCHRLSIACSAAWPGVIEETAKVMALVMPTSRVGRRNRTGCVDVNSQSMHWPCLFPQHGPGMKHKRKIELASWQQEIVDEFTEEFIRGLIHSDGCRSMNRVRRPLKGGDRWYEYPRYTFSNESDDIKRSFTDALDRLGIAWKRMNRKNISVARREAVARLDEFVGPKY